MSREEIVQRFGLTTPSLLDAAEALKIANERADALGVADTTMDEINAKIAQYRAKERTRRDRFSLRQWISDKVDSYRFRQAVDAMRKISIRNGNCDMTLDEINAEIDAARMERINTDALMLG